MFLTDHVTADRAKLRRKAHNCNRQARAYKKIGALKVRRGYARMAWGFSILASSK